MSNVLYLLLVTKKTEGKHLLYLLLVTKKTEANHLLYLLLVKKKEQKTNHTNSTDVPICQYVALTDSTDVPTIKVFVRTHK